MIIPSDSTQYMSAPLTPHNRGTTTQDAMGNTGDSSSTAMITPYGTVPLQGL